MSKVKQYYTDVAEKAVDTIINKVKQNLITKETAIADILKVDNLNLTGIDEHNVDEVVDMECA
jgi:predicted HAD superfamily Cof-like phosphohydrolase|tara:strand:+ start:815 stop:1003 length:189 start_codon:yes stop_codon:yes gene_type:complete